MRIERYSEVISQTCNKDILYISTIVFLLQKKGKIIQLNFFEFLLTESCL
jgi:hypothetical protein